MNNRKFELHLGDCLEVMKDLPQVDAVITDPPYFLPQQSYVGTREKGYSKRHLGDMSVFDGYFQMIFTALNSLLSPTGTSYIFCDAKSYPFFFRAMYPYYKHVRLLIWDKVVSYNGYTWRHQHELIAWGEREDAERVPTGDGDIISVRGVLQKERKHPAEKPVSLIKKLIAKHDFKVILDPFMGSGTTGVACAELGRRFIGIEIDSDYYKIAEKRISAAYSQLLLPFD